MSGFLAGLLWKGSVTAVVIVAVARLAERLGPFLASVFMGLPVSIGPATVLLALDQDDAFIARSMLYSLANATTTLLFLLGYVVAARRVGMWGCLGVAYAIWLSGAFLLGAVPLTLPLALLIVAAGFLGVHVAMPRGTPGPVRGRVAPWRFILLRGALGGLVVGTVVSLADAIGPALSGLFVGFPVVFASAAWMLNSIRDNDFAAAVLSTADRGMLSYSAFCLTVHLLAGPLPALAAIAVGFAVSALVAAGLAFARKR